MTADDLARSDRLSKLLDWFYNVDSLRDVIVEGVAEDSTFLDALERWVGNKTGFSVCPDLEVRFKVLDGFLMTPLQERLRYRWYRMGFSTRYGPCAYSPWKKAIPATATLVEGDASVPYSRICRVELATPHFFCYGTGARGERAVVAVWKSGR